MEKVNLCLSGLKVKDGHISKSRVDAVAEAAMKALKNGKSAGEVADAVVLHAKSSTKEQRLAAFYALHAVVWVEKKKLEDKNSKHRTEKRGALSIALESKVESVMALMRDCPPKEREQVSKILQKWSERFVFPAELCRLCAQAADCAVPTEPAPSSPSMKKKKDEPSAIPPIPSLTSFLPAPLPKPVIIAYKPSTERLPSLEALKTDGSRQDKDRHDSSQNIYRSGYDSFSKSSETKRDANPNPPVQKSGWSSFVVQNKKTDYKDDRRDDRRPDRRSPDRRDKRSRWDA